MRDLLIKSFCGGPGGGFFKKSPPGRRRHGFIFLDRRKNIDYKYFLRLMVDRKE
jgi:hypothetical protein